MIPAAARLYPTLEDWDRRVLHAAIDRALKGSRVLVLYADETQALRARRWYREWSPSAMYAYVQTASFGTALTGEGFDLVLVDHGALFRLAVTP